MTWFDASVCVPASCDKVLIIYTYNGILKLGTGYFPHEDWIIDGDYINHQDILEWRPISK